MAERVYPKAARFIIKKFRPFRKFRHLLLLLLFMFLRHPFAVVLKRSQTIFLIKSNGKRTTTATAKMATKEFYFVVFWLMLKG